MLTGHGYPGGLTSPGSPLRMVNRTFILPGGQETSMQPATALLLMAHGSRHAEANADLWWLAEQLQADYKVVVPSYLELAEPSIVEGGRQCVAAGAHRVIMVPYFLSAGVHVQRDLQGLRQELSGEHPGVEFVLAEPLGRHPLLVDVVRARIAACGLANN